MTTLELEANKARLAHAILSIDNASLLAEVKKKLGDLLTINGPAVKASPDIHALFPKKCRIW